MEPDYSKEAAMTAAIKGLVYKEDIKGKVDAFTAERKKMFDGQNNSAAHALTLHVDSAKSEIRILVFNPAMSLVSAIPGTGMKTAFTKEPIQYVTAQNGTNTSLTGADGDRDILAAALYIAEAMEKKFGVDAFGATLGDILKLDAKTRTMQFMFGCGKGANQREYNAIYTLIFEPSPIVLDRTDVVLSAKAVTTLIPTTSLTGLVWSSSNDQVARVDQSGNVTAVSDGVATISVNAAGGIMPAQAKVTVLGEASIFTCGYSETQLNQVTVSGGDGGWYQGSLMLPDEGDEKALYIKMPNVDEKMEITIQNSMGTFEFASDVALKNKTMKIPSKILRDDYSKNKYHGMIVQIGDCNYNMKFTGTEGVTTSPDVPMIDMGEMKGTYVCEEKKLYVADINGKIKVYLPGDSAWSDPSVEDGRRYLDAEGQLIRSTIKAGYKVNAMFSPDPVAQTLTLIEVSKPGVIDIEVGEVYTRAEIEDTLTNCENKRYLLTNWKGTFYADCEFMLVEGICQNEAEHFTECTDSSCIDPSHVVLCGHDSVEYSWQTATIPCPKYKKHSEECPNKELHRNVTPTEPKEAMQMPKLPEVQEQEIE